MFYATDNHYAVAVCVLIRQLQQLGLREDADVVVLHLPIARFIIETMHKMNVLTREVSKLPPARHRYFRNCLVKLYTLSLTEYERVLYLDADTLPCGNLNCLFDLPLAEAIAAPPAYWLPQPFVTTLLLLVKPSERLWDRARKHFEAAYDQNLCDMDIINMEFKGQIHFLPHEYGCLDSEWEDKDAPFRFGDPDTTFEKTKVVHFSGLGKPWFHHPDTACRRFTRARQQFLDLRRQWWDAREDIIRESRFGSKLAYLYVKSRGKRDRLPWLWRLSRRYAGHRLPWKS